MLEHIPIFLKEIMLHSLYKGFEMLLWFDVWDFTKKHDLHKSSSNAHEGKCLKSWVIQPTLAQILSIKPKYIWVFLGIEYAPGIHYSTHYKFIYRTWVGKGAATYMELCPHKCLSELLSFQRILDQEKM